MTSAVRSRNDNVACRTPALPFHADYALYGVAFRLCSNDRVLLASMQNVVPFGALETRWRDDGLLVSLQRLPSGAFQGSIAGDGPLVESELKPMLERLKAGLMVHVANYARDRVFVHAGVVGWKGRALVFPGPSFAGKSTLVAALVRAGATYYSDEYAVVDQQGRVHPYARDLQMREPGLAEQRGVPAATLSAKIGAVPLHATQVLLANYAPGAQWRPQPLTAGAAVLEMLRHTIPVQRTPARVMATLTAMMRTATAARSERGDAAETAKAILSATGVRG